MNLIQKMAQMRFSFLTRTQTLFFPFFFLFFFIYFVVDSIAAASRILSECSIFLSTQHSTREVNEHQDSLSPVPFYKIIAHETAKYRFREYSALTLPFSTLHQEQFMSYSTAHYSHYQTYEGRFMNFVHLFVVQSQIMTHMVIQNQNSPIHQLSR